MQPKLLKYILEIESVIEEIEFIKNPERVKYISLPS